jgi:hypothetical protein
MASRLNINESFICRIWDDREKYLTALLTADSDPVEIIDPGNRNFNSGPDYTDAKIKIGGKTFAGDIEVHRDFKGWIDHNHNHDRRYNSVILQVVLWDSGIQHPVLKNKRYIPTVILSSFLTKSIHEIWQEIINNPSINFRLPCVNSEPDELNIREMLGKLALERLNMKSGRLQERLEDILKENESGSIRSSESWKQALFEYLFEALGYSKNKEPMLKLAKSISIKSISGKLTNNIDKDLLLLQAVLYGSGGFLFDTRIKDEYVLTLKQMWESSKKDFINSVYKSEWVFFRLRPQNFPTVRIATGSELLRRIIKEELLKNIIRCFESAVFEVKPAHKEIHALFNIEPEGYWSNHYHFGKISKGNYSKLGKQRINDIIINVIIPFVYLYSQVFSKDVLKKNILKYYASVKVNSDNEVLRVMEEQLLKKNHIAVNTPAIEQAVIQLHNFYCVRQKCDNCKIRTDMVKDRAYDYRIIFY